MSFWIKDHCEGSQSLFFMSQLSMTVPSPFIQSIHIHQVRHLKDILIQLDAHQPKHLILTGPNGCGKTSLLQAIKNVLEGIPNGELLELERWPKLIQQERNNIIKRGENVFSQASTIEEQITYPRYIAESQKSIELLQEKIDQFSALQLALSDAAQMVELYQEGKFLISFFQAKRSATIAPVNGAQRLDLPALNPIKVDERSVGSRFLQFMVNQQNRAALLKLKGDEAGAKDVQLWMDNITQKFRALFQDEKLKLEYDIDRFDFTVHLSNREPFRLVDNELSDGFAAALQIVVELLMRMEAVAPGQRNYNVPGIALIDEIETHLHIKLQKAILPFLTAFFPRIQFIVTTHSPFVLTSLNEAVIFDLESHERWENMTPLSASAVVEEYFDLDLYSDAIKQKVWRLKELSAISLKTEAEIQELQTICQQLDVIDFDRAPELVAQYHAMLAQTEAR